MLRALIGITVIVWSVGYLGYIVQLLNSQCAHVTPLHFVGIGVFIVGGFAVMLPDKEE